MRIKFVVSKVYLQMTLLNVAPCRRKFRKYTLEITFKYMLSLASASIWLMSDDDRCAHHDRVRKCIAKDATSLEANIGCQRTRGRSTMSGLWKFKRKRWKYFRGSLWIHRSYLQLFWINKITLKSYNAIHETRRMKSRILCDPETQFMSRI